jgi:hypothetical protein
LPVPELAFVWMLLIVGTAIGDYRSAGRIAAALRWVVRVGSAASARVPALIALRPFVADVVLALVVEFRIGRANHVEE